MYFWKVDALAQVLIEGKVTPKEEFKYYLLYTIIITIVTDPLFCSVSSLNPYDIVLFFLNITIVIIGTYVTYKINAEGDNKDFILRSILLGLPIFVRTLALLLPLVFLLIIIDETFQEITLLADVSSIGDIVLTMIALLFYFWQLAKYIKIVSHHKNHLR